MPQRIRLQRTKGWRVPTAARVVARPSQWGNPFPARDGNHAAAVLLFRRYAEERLQREPEWLDPLRGRDLAYWCRFDEPCHADVLLELANRRS